MPTPTAFTAVANHVPPYTPLRYNTIRDDGQCAETLSNRHRDHQARVLHERNERQDKKHERLEVNREIEMLGNMPAAIEQSEDQSEHWHGQKKRPRHRLGNALLHARVVRRNCGGTAR